MHYPDSPSALCSARFAHGIARELVRNLFGLRVVADCAQWGAMSAMGIASSVEEVLPNQQTRAGLPALIKAVLQQAQWEGMRIKISMDRLSFTALEPLLFSMRDFSNSHLGGGAWWTWPEVANAEMPYWWNAPNELVVRMYPAPETSSTHVDNTAAPDGKPLVRGRGDGRARIRHSRRGPGADSQASSRELK